MEHNHNCFFSFYRFLYPEVWKCAGLIWMSSFNVIYNPISDKQVSNKFSSKKFPLSWKIWISPLGMTSQKPVLLESKSHSKAFGFYTTMLWYGFTTFSPLLFSGPQEQWITFLPGHLPETIDIHFIQGSLNEAIKFTLILH